MKILRYELKRIRLGRLFPIMLLCNLIYATIWMGQTGISGTGGTAPFSQWTYLAYCGAMLPAAILTLLLLQANYYSDRQQKADILPLASPYTAGALMLVRIAALAVCFLILFVLEFAFFAVPNLLYFGKIAVLAYPLTGLLHMLPAVILSLALGGVLGKLQNKLIYVLAVLLFALSMVQPAVACDLFGSAFFSEYPLKLPVGADGEPAFRIVPLWLCTRLLYLTAGAVLIACGVCRYRKPKLDHGEDASPANP